MEAPAEEHLSAACKLTSAISGGTHLGAGVHAAGGQRGLVCDSYVVLSAGRGLAVLCAGAWRGDPQVILKMAG